MSWQMQSWWCSVNTAKACGRYGPCACGLLISLMVFYIDLCMWPFHFSIGLFILTCACMWYFHWPLFNIDLCMWSTRPRKPRHCLLKICVWQFLNGDEVDTYLHNLQMLNLRLFSAIFFFVLSLSVFFSFCRSSGTCPSFWLFPLGKVAKKNNRKKCGLLPNWGGAGSRMVVKCQTSILEKYFFS